MKFKVLMKKLWRKVRGGNPDVYELRLRGVSIGENCHIYVALTMVMNFWLLLVIMLHLQVAVNY